MWDFELPVRFHSGMLRDMMPRTCQACTIRSGHVMDRRRAPFHHVLKHTVPVSLFLATGAHADGGHTIP